jgi:hypothetical protein
MIAIFGYIADVARELKINMKIPILNIHWELSASLLGASTMRV